MGNVDSASGAQHDAERGIRDLMSLLALSSSWLETDGITVVEQMLEAVARLTPVNFGYCVVSVAPSVHGTVRLLIDDRLCPSGEVPTWSAAVRNWDDAASISGAGMGVVPTPMGELKVVRLKLGISSLVGTVWFGSDAPSFPTTTELAILRAAASLAATAIQAANVRYERDQSHKAKDDFLAMLGHELRNPLAPIRSGVNALQMKNVTLELVAKTAAIMDRQVRHMTGLVDSLLDVSRLATGAVILAEELVDMNEVLRDAYEQIGPSFEAKSQIVRRDIAAESAFVSGDRNRLVQVIGNLLNNASKYTEPGGEITLSLQCTAKCVVVAIQDNGIGIEADMLTKVFQPFAQAKRSADR